VHDRGNEMTEASLSGFALIVGAMGALLAGCVQPNSDTAAGRSEIVGQKDNLCIVQNPGITTSARQSVSSV
jgi:hypothetical protein